jgi:glycosyltransferase involved in cell wall biosynthesis
MLSFASRRSISTSPKMLGEMTVSMLKGEAGFQQKEISKMLDWLNVEGKPDVISLPYSLLLGLAKPLKDALDRPVLCTLQGEDLFLDGLGEPYRSESKQLISEHLKYIDAFISVSQYYAEFMPRYLGVPAEKIRVVPLGINLEGYSKKERDSSQPFTIGFFARVAPEKGLHVLAEAYRHLRKNDRLENARLSAAGYLAPEHRSYLSEIQEAMNHAGLGSEFKYEGVVDRQQKIAFLQSIDVLSVPATYNEPKGIFLLEAMACGVPVLQPRRGGFTEVVERTGGGLLVEPDNVEALAEGILKLARDSDLRASLGENGFKNVREHYSVARMADSALEAYASVIS